MNKRDVKYTRLTLKNLVGEAKSLGIEVGFTTDMDGNYIVSHKTLSFVPGRPDLATTKTDIYTPDTVAMAHWLIRGMTAQANNQIINAQALRSSGL